MTVQLAIARLARTAQLSTSEERGLLDACSGPKRFEARRELLREGTRAPAAFLLLSGIAGRFVGNADGRAQSTAYLLSGDLCGKRALLCLPMDHSVRTLSAVDAVMIPRDALDRLAVTYPNIARGFLRLMAIEAAIARQWLLNVGNRDALAALAHLFCELFERLQASGETIENTCRMPFTQADLADALAITPVHLNRTLMCLRKSGLVSLRNGRLSILDAAALRATAKFNPLYLNGSEGAVPQSVLAPDQRVEDRIGISIRRGDSPSHSVNR